MMPDISGGARSIQLSYSPSYQTVIILALLDKKYALKVNNLQQLQEMYNPRVNSSKELNQKYKPMAESLDEVNKKYALSQNTSTQFTDSLKTAN